MRVRAADLELARAFLEQSKESAGEIDWDEVEGESAELDESEIDLGENWVDKGLFIRVIAVVFIVVLILMMFKAVLGPSAGNGLTPGG